MRLVWIDNIKFLCIFLMVLCHFGLRGDFAVELIYGFHMPMLFLVSGYLYKKRPLQDELKAFGVPILLFSLIGILYSLTLQVYLFDKESFVEYISKTIPAFFTANHGAYHTPFTGIWFVLGLLFTRLFFLKVDIDKYGLVVSIICYFVTECNNFFDITTLLKDVYLFKPLQIIPYFYLGYMINRGGVYTYVSAN